MNEALSIGCVAPLLLMEKQQYPKTTSKDRKLRAPCESINPNWRWLVPSPMANGMNRLMDSRE